MNDIIEHTPQNDAPGVVSILARAEIDMQIETAQRFPRSLSKAMRNITQMVQLSQRVAEDCIYTLPRDGKSLVGPSIRLAEIIFSQWGNARLAARVVHVDRKEMFVEAEAMYHDLETNSAQIARSRRSLRKRNGQLVSEDMIIVIGNAACAIAKRNAVFAGIPKAIWGEAFESALSTLRGDVQTLTERRATAIRALGAMGLTPDHIFGLLGISGEKEIGLDELVTLSGYRSAIKNEETTVEALIREIGEREETEQPARARSAIAAPRRASTARKPADNPASDAAFNQEANRVAAARQKAAEDEAAKAREDAARAAKMAEDHAAAEANREDNAARAKMQEERDRMREEAQQREQDEAEATKQQENRDAYAEAEDGRFDEPFDPETGEILQGEADTAPEPAAKNQPDRAQYQRLYDKMVDDLIDGMKADDVKAGYESEIASMKRHFPDLYENLMNEMSEA